LFEEDVTDEEIIKKINELNLDIKQYKVSDGLSLFDHAAKRGFLELSKFCMNQGMSFLKKNYLQDSPFTIAIRF